MHQKVASALLVTVYVIVGLVMPPSQTAARIVNAQGINVSDPRVVTLRPLQFGLQFEKRV
jgi:hypothetical protein